MKLHNEILFNEYERVQVTKRFIFTLLLQIKLVRNIFGSKHHAFKTKVHAPMILFETT